jgi:hypothetical protein
VLCQLKGFERENNISLTKRGYHIVAIKLVCKNNRRFLVVQGLIICKQSSGVVVAKISWLVKSTMDISLFVLVVQAGYVLWSGVALVHRVKILIVVDNFVRESVSLTVEVNHSENYSVHILV